MAKKSLGIIVLLAGLIVGVPLALIVLLILVLATIPALIVGLLWTACAGVGYANNHDFRLKIIKINSLYQCVKPQIEDVKGFFRTSKNILDNKA